MDNRLWRSGEEQVGEADGAVFSALRRGERPSQLVESTEEPSRKMVSEGRFMDGTTGESLGTEHASWPRDYRPQ